ncbi:Predicted transcription regulator containing HTH domain [Sphingobacterium spiritivorum]|uniref:Predicted transcription regulator containing HTH domain n=1 Tax=Sphingobacterium spiritivorum TaxID=258 RepID=A0A380BIA1_SPHSI|nr:helix-turn-helix transcriptional regulator [Sphingobacterium spiritivorum]SUJ01077.1 Predicted transcription regulator containing HTH domain [Sphingobacterium spiritivorum]
MKTHFDIEKLVESGAITSELDYERALIADRNLRLLAKDNDHFKKLRFRLRDLIEQYENTEWNNADQIDEDKIRESDKAERLAEVERIFIRNRKEAIRDTLKRLTLTQQDLATLLGHKSKTHMSELINGIKPFTLTDLVIINRILKIDITLLVPTFLSFKDQVKVKAAVTKIDKPQLKLAIDDLVVCD